jgi:multiple sugar transport system substrate-binding protein
VTAVRISRRSIIASALALGLQQRPHASTGNVTLRVNATPSIFKPTFEKLREEFVRRRPDIGIELRISSRDQEDQVQATLRQALIGDLPDVSFEGIKYLRMLQRRRIGVPLTQLIASDGDWRSDKYSDSLIRSTRVDGQILAVATAVSLPIIYYNVDRVSEVHGQQLDLHVAGGQLGRKHDERRREPSDLRR